MPLSVSLRAPAFTAVRCELESQPLRVTWFAAYSSPVSSQPPTAHMTEPASQNGEDVIYFRRGQDWLAASGLRNGIKN
jgi:hypothetical protein